MNELSHGLSTPPPLRVLMVCTGNICRSPMAASILSTAAETSDVAGRLLVDSAGTHSYHVGAGADRRAQAALREAGYRPDHTARVMRREWLTQRDLILAMDVGHIEHLRRMAAKAHVPTENLRLLRDFDPEGPGDVPDPYYDTIAEFRGVRTMIERSMPLLLTELAAIRPGDRRP